MITETDETSAIEAHINSVIEKYRQYVNPGLTRLLQFGGFGDLEVFAEGCVVTLASGTQCLDFLGGYGVFSLGHRNPAVVDAVKRQLDRMPLSTRAYFHEPQALLSERLAQVTPGELSYSFYSNSGAESVEAALKFARKATGRTKFVSTEGAYHGKTMGSLAVTGREKYRKPFGPMVPGTTFVPFNSADAVAAVLDGDTAAVILETVQGEGGIVPAVPGYLADVRRITREAGVLLIVDEVQTGLGRTGRLFGCEHDDVQPDIMTLAKALGGGVMPIGATVFTQEVCDAVFGENPYIHTSTFGGNQLACAAGLAALQVTVDDELSARSVRSGARLMAGLRSAVSHAPGVLKEVRGLGLMVGVEFAVQDVAELTINGMARRGVIAGYTLNNPKVIRFEPPLIVSDSQLDQAVNAFGESVNEAVSLLQDIE